MNYRSTIIEEVLRPNSLLSQSQLNVNFSTCTKYTEESKACFLLFHWEEKSRTDKDIFRNTTVVITAEQIRDR